VGLVLLLWKFKLCGKSNWLEVFGTKTPIIKEEEATKILL
jgi:hypothetical protein